MSAAPPVERLAEAIVARDLVAGRPGKSAAGATIPPGATLRPVDATPTSPVGRAPVLAAVAAVIVATIVALVIGLLSGDTERVATSAPTAAVLVHAQAPDTVTVPANPTYDAAVRISTSFTCPGQAARVVTNTAQLTIGSGRFVLDPTALPTFSGTLAGNAITAAATDGTLTGTLAGGLTETFSWAATTSPYSPCAGTFPITATLPQPLSLQPTVAEGPALAGSIDPGTAVVGLAVRQPGSGVNWGLVAGGEAAALTGLLVILILSPGIQDEDGSAARRAPAAPR